MQALMALGTISLVLCLLLTPLCRDLCLRFNVVDLPDNGRKQHQKPVPRIGGLPIAFSYLGALAFMLALAPKAATIAIQHRSLFSALLPASGIIFLTGLIDDVLGLKPWQKLMGQFAGAMVAVAAGARITFLDGHHYSPFFAVPFSVVWLLACTNAFNLIDGIDGLACGVGLFSTLTALLAAILQGNWGLATAIIPLVGGLLAFLCYNFNPASIFLGDSGSLTIGFLLGCFGIIWSQKSATFLGLLAPAMALALPLFDVLLAIARRYLRKQPIFAGDRGHIHHRLLAFGFHPRVVAIILYAACGVAAALSLLQSSLSYHWGGEIVLLFCILAFFGVKKLQYIEFSTVVHMFRKGEMLQMVQHEIYLKNLETALLEARTRTECWSVIRNACKELHFSSAQLVLEGETFQEVFEPRNVESAWHFSKSLGRKGRLTLTRAMHSESQSLMTSFFHVLQRCIETKNYRPGFAA
jgi:UDP-GlcNAc:undecaprenyl-phosphate GlcNAc-1-phosphate transferase